MAKYERQWTGRKSDTDVASLEIILPPVPDFSAEWQISVISGFCDVEGPMSVGVYLDGDPEPVFEANAIRSIVLPFPDGLYCGVGRGVTISVIGLGAAPPPGTLISISATGNLHSVQGVQFDGPLSGFLFRNSEVIS